MSGPSDEDTAVVILRALGILAHDGANEHARATLAGSTVLVPWYGADDCTDPFGLSLPVTERTVLVFTSEERMVRSLPDVLHYCLVPLGALPAHWPERDPTLTIDIGSPDSVLLTAEGVRLLLATGAAQGRATGATGATGAAQPPAQVD
ncbi:SseB family protein [Streptomyces apricus]|uniref:SseB family protein n=1 Tax=Streptomyces apricus TaxID=1828112 RepID=UPI00165F7FAA|nr:SseB family protein [Streptomyces apricus]